MLVLLCSSYKLKDEQLKANFQNILNAGKPERLNGDINDDGAVNIVDVILLQKHLLNKATLTVEQAEYADFNQDGVLNSFDLIAIKRALLANG